jgi:hypothetical protein
MAGATRERLVDRRFKTEEQCVKKCVEGVRQRSASGWYRCAIDSAKGGAAHVRLVVEGNPISLTQPWLTD